MLHQWTTGFRCGLCISRHLEFQLARLAYGSYHRNRFQDPLIRVQGWLHRYCLQGVTNSQLDEQILHVKPEDYDNHRAPHYGDSIDSLVLHLLMNEGEGLGKLWKTAEGA